MQIERTVYPHEHRPEIEFEGTPEWDRFDPPQFSVCIGWHHPERLRQPFIQVHFWRWRVLVGWLNAVEPDDA